MTDKKQTAFITGGTRGIGKAIALEFAESGYNLALNFRSNEVEAQSTKEECEKLGAEVLLLMGDISQDEFCKSAIAEIVDTYGSIEVLVNNAGITRDGLIVKMKEEDFDAVIEANLKSAYLTSKYSVKHMMKKRYGKIINIASISGTRGNPGQVNYSASKAGLIGMTKTLAKELGSRKINVNCVSPGFIQTQMTEVLPENVKDKMIENIPLGEFGNVEDIAKAVRFLASDNAAYITGQVLSVDGGMSI